MLLLLTIFPFARARQGIHAAAERRNSALHADGGARNVDHGSDEDSSNTGSTAEKTPEVTTVFGKAGQAETATDPAPLSMFETIVSLKPSDQWPRGMTWDKFLAELNMNMQTPGMANIFWMPIQTRTEMLTTGFRSALGIKVFGPDLQGNRESRRSDRDGDWRSSRHAQRVRRANRGRLFPRFRCEPRSRGALRINGRRCK